MRGVGRAPQEPGPWGRLPGDELDCWKEGWRALQAEHPSSATWRCPGLVKAQSSWDQAGAGDQAASAFQTDRSAAGAEDARTSLEAGGQLEG